MPSSTSFIEPSVITSRSVDMGSRPGFYSVVPTEEQVTRAVDDVYYTMAAYGRIDQGFTQCQVCSRRPIRNYFVIGQMDWNPNDEEFVLVDEAVMCKRCSETYAPPELLADAQSSISGENRRLRIARSEQSVIGEVIEDSCPGCWHTPHRYRCRQFNCQCDHRGLGPDIDVDVSADQVRETRQRLVELGLPPRNMVDEIGTALTNAQANDVFEVMLNGSLPSNPTPPLRSSVHELPHIPNGTYSILHDDHSTDTFQIHTIQRASTVHLINCRVFRTSVAPGETILPIAFLMSDGSPELWSRYRHAGAQRRNPQFQYINVIANALRDHPILVDRQGTWHLGTQWNRLDNDNGTSYNLYIDNLDIVIEPSCMVCNRVIENVTFRYCNEHNQGVPGIRRDSSTITNRPIHQGGRNQGRSAIRRLVEAANEQFSGTVLVDELGHGEIL